MNWIENTTDLEALYGLGWCGGHAQGCDTFNTTLSQVDCGL
jgi:hypothetical protein